MKRYAVPSLANLRDLGGYPTLEGGYTQYGRILRSDCPKNFDDRDIKAIEKLHIETVIDFRLQKEIDSAPSYFQNHPSVSYHNLEFKVGHEPPKTEENLSEIYLEMMEEKATMRSILETIADANGPVLYHCAVGKDRTGIVTAVILMLCHVPKEDIIADYQLSATYLHKEIKAFHEAFPHIEKWRGGSKPEYMQRCLELFYDKYHTVENYLDSLELKENTIEKIRAKLLGE